MVYPRTTLHWFLLAACAAILVWSGIDPKDRATWILEVAPPARIAGSHDSTTRICSGSRSVHASTHSVDAMTTAGANSATRTLRQTKSPQLSVVEAREREQRHARAGHREEHVPLRVPVIALRP